MKLYYEFNEDGTIQGAAFTGCSGLERVSTVKGALGVLQVDNPLIVFREAVHDGKFDGIPDEEYDRLFSTVKCLAGLFRFPDDPPDAKAQRQMNVLSLLANAVTKVVELDVALREYEEEQEL